MPDCHYCNRPTDPSRAYRRVTGWERKSRVASRRRGSDVVLRQVTDEYACEDCIVRLREGLPIEQGSLLFETGYDGFIA